MKILSIMILVSFVSFALADSKGPVLGQKSGGGNVCEGEQYDNCGPCKAKCLQLHQSSRDNLGRDVQTVKTPRSGKKSTVKQ